MYNTPLKTVALNGWKKGIDTQNDIFGNGEFTAFRELTNFIVQPGGTLVPRPPCKDYGGEFGTRTQGLVYIKGVFYTFIKDTDINDAIGNVASNVQLLTFDSPEYVTADWTLLEQGVYENYAYAIIRHGYTSAVVPTRIFLHVWDTKKNTRTFVTDPYVPVDWGPFGFPLHSYGVGAGIRGSWHDYTPASTVTIEKGHISTVDGNVAFSGIGRLRVWNPYDAATIEKSGLPYYWIMPTTTDPVYFAIPETWDYFGSVNKFAGYVVEEAQADGSWLKYTEATAVTSSSVRSFAIQSYTPSWYTGTATRVVISPQTDGTLLRLRIAVTPEPSIVSGCTLNPDAATIVGAGVITFEGASYPSTALTLASLSAGTYYVGIQIIAGVARGTAILTSDARWSFGSFRYSFYILATVVIAGGPTLSSTTIFSYPNILNEQWYVNLHTENLTYKAGGTETGFLNTSSHNPGDANITALQAVKDRLMVCSPNDTQLWGVTADPSSNSFLDRYDFGTQNRSTLFYNRPAINTQRGIRAFDLVGLNFNALDDVNIGEDIQNLASVNVVASAFWPWFGSYVAFCELANTNRYADSARLSDESPFAGSDIKYGFLILSYSKESEVAAWSWNPVATLNQLFGYMTAVNDRLYMRSGNKFYYLDAHANKDCVDDTDGNFFTSRFVTQYTHCGKPGAMKRFISLNTLGDGRINMQAFVNPWQTAALAQAGPTFTGLSLGMPRVPFTATGTVLALQGTSVDAPGARLVGFTADFRALGK